MTMLGVDVSKWQGVGAGDEAPDFIIAKATEGAGYVDPNCDGHIQRALSQGKSVGVYHYARPDLNDPITEARFFVQNIQGYLGKALLALDWEQPGTQHNIAWAKQWLDEVQRLTSIKPLIYMSASIVNQYDWRAVAEANYGLWIAGYPDLRDSWDIPEFPYGIGVWSFYAIWQYTNSNGRLDRDIFQGDKNAWNAYAKSNGEAKPAPVPIKKTNEQIADEVIAGKWGNGADRKNRLTAAGYDYRAVQDIVNKKLGGGGSTGHQYYKIQSGDTLSGIAAKFGTSVSQLCAWNGISNPDLIYAGNTIRVK